MLYTDLTKKAQDICFRAHEYQKDKGGLPYVFHPFHLADQMETEEEVCTALLHDVMEDTAWRPDQLKAEGFPDLVMEALALLTHDESVPYLDYVRDLKDHPVAAKVKLADLRHNSTAGRLKPAQDRWAEQRNTDRMKKYLRAQAILTGGTADLEAMELVLERILPAGASGPEVLRICLSPDGRVRRYAVRSSKSGERLFTDKTELFEYLLQHGVPVRDILEALKVN